MTRYRAPVSRTFAKKMKIYHTILLIFLVFRHIVSAESNNAELAQEPRLKNIYSEVRSLVGRHYPEATSHLLGAKIHFESNTRVYVIHVPLKTGEWQDPWEERGPKKGGILGKIELRDGKYGGAAVVPQTFDRRYYEVMLMAPYSEEHDCHLYVHLYVPFNSTNHGGSRVIGTEIGISTKIFGYYIESAKEGFVLLHWYPDKPGSRVYAEPTKDREILTRHAAQELAETTEMALQRIEKFQRK